MRYLSVVAVIAFAFLCIFLFDVLFKAFTTVAEVADAARGAFKALPESPSSTPFSSSMESSLGQLYTILKAIIVNKTSFSILLALSIISLAYEVYSTTRRKK